MPRGTRWGVAKPQVVDGIRFASKAEAARYGELKLLERAGEIRDLTLERRFPLIGTRGPLRFVDSNRPVVYVADFDYVTRDGSVCIEDVKGYADKGSPVYRLFNLKRALMADRGLTVRVVK